MTGDMSVLGIGLNYNQWSNYTPDRFISVRTMLRFSVSGTTILSRCSPATRLSASIMPTLRTTTARVRVRQHSIPCDDFISTWPAGMSSFPTNNTSAVNIDGNDVTNLTVPIVTENTTEEEARNNPRATTSEMFDFTPCRPSAMPSNTSATQAMARLPS